MNRMTVLVFKILYIAVLHSPTAVRDFPLVVRLALLLGCISKERFCFLILGFQSKLFKARFGAFVLVTQSICIPGFNLSLKTSNP
jgi:hypothetical protein